MSSVMPSPEGSKCDHGFKALFFQFYILLLEIRTLIALLFICCTISIFSTKLQFSWVGQKKMLARWADGWQAATQP